LTQGKRRWEEKGSGVGSGWWLVVRVQGSGFRVQDSGFRIQGSGFRVQDSGFRKSHSRIDVVKFLFRIPQIAIPTTPLHTSGAN
jgi:hypothetical protein